MEVSEIAKIKESSSWPIPPDHGLCNFFFFPNTQRQPVSKVWRPAKVHRTVADKDGKVLD